MENPKMKRNATWTRIGLVVIAAAATAVSFAGEPAKQTPPTGSPPDMPPEMLEAMNRWKDFATPGEHHNHLQQWVGEWNITVSYRMTPDAPAEENTMTAVSKSVMGGRYIIEKVSGEVMGPDGQGMVPFEGMSIMGYDNHKKQYFSTWMDNMSTSLMQEWGTCDGTGKVLTTEGRGYDPMSGSERASKSIATVIDADSRRLEMFVPGPDGNMFKQMEIAYTRKK